MLLGSLPGGDDENDEDGEKPRRARAVVKMRQKKWRDGIVPYELSSEFSESMN